MRYFVFFCLGLMVSVCIFSFVLDRVKIKAQKDTLFKLYLLKHTLIGGVVFPYALTQTEVEYVQELTCKNSSSFSIQSSGDKKIWYDVPLSSNPQEIYDYVSKSDLFFRLGISYNDKNVYMPLGSIHTQNRKRGINDIRNPVNTRRN